MKIKEKLALMLSVSVLLGGCGVKEGQEVSYPDSYAVYNPQNIMETENGFYVSGGSSLFLQYHDKLSDNEIMLCDKPECPHDGRNTCTATYNAVHTSNVVLYNDSLYFAGAEGDGENVTFSLYRVKNDGSSLDRLCSVYTVKSDRTTDTADCGGSLIIHRGYAFLDICSGSNYADFMGGGFYRINLRNNEVTQLRKYDDYFSEQIHRVIPCGDYIITCQWDSSRKSRYFRMKTDENEAEEIFITERESMYPVTADESDIYLIDTSCNDNTGAEVKVVVCDAETLREKYDFKVPYGDMVLYDGKIIPFRQWNENLEAVSVPVYENGKLVAEVKNIPGKPSHTMYVSFSSGKMYIRKQIFEPDSENSVYPQDFSEYYSCSFEDVLSGNPQWKFEYSTQEMCEMWNRWIRDRAEKGFVAGWSSDF